MSLGPILARDLRRHATALPLAPAVRDAAGDHAYAELDTAADLAAAGLLASGVEPGDRVALLVEPSVEAIASLAAIARAGAVAVPLGTRLTHREIGVALAETSPVLLVRGPGRVAAGEGHGIPSLGPAELAARAASERDGRSQRPPPPLLAEAPAVAILTSGTTGRPKAALLSHAALAASALAWMAALPPATGWLLCLGLDHVAGIGVAWRAFAAGVPLRILAGFDPERVLAALGEADAPSHVSLVPTQLTRLLDVAGTTAGAGAGAAGLPGPPAGLRAVLLGGAVIPPALVSRAVAAGWPVVPTYGLTEAGSGVTVLPIEEAARYPASAGRPLPGVQVRIAGPGADGTGEIEVLTPAVFGGYQGRPVETASAFSADGWLRTGDLGRLDGEGRLFVMERREDLLVSGGENVYPGEVEEVLAAHPAVADAGVVARPNPTWGAVPVAGLVLRSGVADPGDDVLRAWCRERLAPAKVPAAFVRLDALPRTGSGKLRRRALRDRLVPALVLLHATLSTGRQLGPLARALAAASDCRVLAPDRRGSGGRRLADPRPVAMDEHLLDLAALLDAEGIERAILVGHSFGGALAIEAASRLADRVAGVVAYEPPYGPVADEPVRQAFASLARATADAFETGGAAAAAQVFVDGAGGPGSWEGLPARSRAYLVREGAGALADAGLSGLQPDGLGRIACPVVILIGSASEPFYRPIADALVARIPGARRVDLPGLRHTAPITEPVKVAAAVRDALAVAGLLPTGERPAFPARPVPGPARPPRPAPGPVPEPARPAHPAMGEDPA